MKNLEEKIKELPPDLHRKLWILWISYSAGTKGMLKTILVPWSS